MNGLRYLSDKNHCKGKSKGKQGACPVVQEVGTYSRLLSIMKEFQNWECKSMWHEAHVLQ